jgi:hypothetical protein
MQVWCCHDDIIMSPWRSRRSPGFLPPSSLSHFSRHATGLLPSALCSCREEWVLLKFIARELRPFVEWGRRFVADVGSACSKPDASFLRRRITGVCRRLCSSVRQDGVRKRGGQGTLFEGVLEFSGARFDRPGEPRDADVGRARVHPPLCGDGTSLRWWRTKRRCSGATRSTPTAALWAGPC